jgi:hypothetical protein
VAAWFLVAAITLRRPRPSGFLGVGVFLMVRAVVEARYVVALLNPPPPKNPGSSSGLEGIFIGALIISGYLLPAF